MIHVGIYQCGWRWVDLYLDPAVSGGDFKFMGGGGKTHSKMTIGFDDYSEAEVFEILCHETFELLACDRNARFRHTGSYVPNASDSYFFFFNHNDYSEIAAQAGNFIWQCHQDLKAACDLLKEQKGK